MSVNDRQGVSVQEEALQQTFNNNDVAIDVKYILNAACKYQYIKYLGIYSKCKCVEKSVIL